MLKESSRGSVRLIRHKVTGQRFILRRFTGNPEVYKKLLEYTCPNLPTIYEVASQCGIDDVRYFTRLFKEYAGMTPKEYRDKIL